MYKYSGKMRGIFRHSMDKKGPYLEFNEAVFHVHGLSFPLSEEIAKSVFECSQYGQLLLFALSTIPRIFMPRFPAMQHRM